MQGDGRASGHHGPAPAVTRADLETDRETPSRRPVRASLIAAIVFLSAVGPLATDMYVPAFPHVAADLGASVTGVQLTLTTFFAGMGLGQLAGGPFSDQRGRRRPLIAGTVLVLIASACCALAPSIGVLMAARFAQGFGGGWALVVARSVIVDLASGSQLVWAMNVLLGAGALAPILAPLVGAGILQFAQWRVTFWVLAAAGLGMTMCALFVVPESLPPERRHTGGVRALGGAARTVLRERRYVGYVMVNASSMFAVFSYVATSAFVLQTINGLSPAAYSADFAANAGGMMLATLISARLAGRVPTRRVILVGICLSITSGLTMLIGAAWLGAPLLLAVVCFFCLMVAQGLIGPNSGALASGEVPEYAGTGIAVMGLFQSLAASVAAPLTGLFGTTTALPLGVLMVLGASSAMVGLLLVARPSRSPVREGEPR